MNPAESDPNLELTQSQVDGIIASMDAQIAARDEAAHAPEAKSQLDPVILGGPAVHSQAEVIKVQ